MLSSESSASTISGPNADTVTLCLQYLGSDIQNPNEHPSFVFSRLGKKYRQRFFEAPEVFGPVTLQNTMSFQAAAMNKVLGSRAPHVPQKVRLGQFRLVLLLY